MASSSKSSESCIASLISNLSLYLDSDTQLLLTRHLTSTCDHSRQRDLSASELQLGTIMKKLKEGRLSYMSVRNLAIQQECIFSNLTEDSTVSSNELQLKMSNIVLFGVITACPRAPAELCSCLDAITNMDDTLYWCDSTGALPCVLASDIPHSLMDQLVVVIKWNHIKSTILPAYLPASHGCLKLAPYGYLEIGWIISCGHRSSTSSPSVAPDTLSVKAFSTLPREAIREAGKSKKEFSIQGRIAAISSIQKTLKGEKLFFIQLQEGGNSLSCEITVHHPALLHWSHVLTLHHQYLFTRLRINIMKVLDGGSSSDKGRRVLYATRNSNAFDLECSEVPEHKLTLDERASDTQPRVMNFASLVLGSTEQMKVPEKRQGELSASSGEEELRKGKRRKVTQQSVPITSWIMQDEAAIVDKDKPSCEASTHSCHRNTTPNQNVDIADQKHNTIPSDILINYRGTVSRCVFPEAGMYEMDGRLSLYLSTVPWLGAVLGIRDGAILELYNVHLLDREGQKEVAVCSLSSFRITQFSSRTPTAYTPFIPRRMPLLQYSQRLTGSGMVWLLRLYKKLREGLSYINDQCPSLKVLQTSLECLLSVLPLKGLARKRDPLCEIFSDPHLCLFSHTCHQAAPPHVLLAGDVGKLMKDHTSLVGWRDGSQETVKDGTNQTAPNWCFSRLDSTSSTPAMILIGVVDGHPKRGTLMLRDNHFSLELVIPGPISLHIGDVILLKKFVIVVEKISLPNTMQTLHSCVSASPKDIVVLNSPLNEGDTEAVKETQENDSDRSMWDAVDPNCLLVTVKDLHPVSMKHTVEGNTLCPTATATLILH